MGTLLDQLPAQLPPQLADSDLADEPAVASGVGLRALRAQFGDLDRNRRLGELRLVRTPLCQPPARQIEVLNH